MWTNGATDMLLYFVLYTVLCWAPAANAHFRYFNTVLQSFNNCTFTDDLDSSEEHFITAHSRIRSHAYPLLNCTGKNITDTDFSSVPANVSEIVFRNDHLPVFKISDLRRFSDLTSLQFRGDDIHDIIEANKLVPSATDGFPNLQRVVITDSNLKAVPTSFFRHFPKLSELILTHNNITHVAGEDFRGIPELKVLHLSHNPIRSLGLDWLQVASNLATLNLRSVGLTRVPVGLNKTNRVEYLDLSDNYIETLGEEVFRGCARLSTLLLSNNKIQVIHWDAFEGAASLRYVDLTANNIERIPFNIFNQLQSDGLTVSIWENQIHCDGQLKWLAVWMKEREEAGSYPDIRLKCSNPARLHGKRLKDLRPDDFVSKDEVPYEECINGPVTTTSKTIASPTTASMKTMASTNVATSALTYTTAPTSATTLATTRQMDKRCPTDCTCYFGSGSAGGKDAFEYPIVDCSLSVLDAIPEDLSLDTRTLLLDGNSLKTLDLATLKRFEHLKHVNLDHNAISFISCSANDCEMKELEFFSVANNKLPGVYWHLMKNFPKIVQLRLHNNKITEAPRDAFKSNGMLEKLDLGPNPFTQPLPDALFEGLQLRKLSLRGLALREIPECLKDQGELKVLDLSDNEIDQFSSNAFNGCDSLIDLYLSSNNISHLLPGAFSSVPSLVRMDLSDNKLTTLKRSALLGASTNLRHVELWENPLNCDCELLWLRDWSIQLLEADPIAEIHFRCAQPARVRGLTSGRIDEIDFTCDVEESSTDTPVVANSQRASSVYSTSDMAIAIILTILATAALLLVLKFAYARSRRRNVATTNGILRFHKPTQDATPLVSLDSI